MEHIINPYKEKIIQYVTKSKLLVTIVHKPEFVNQAAIIGTSFGGLTDSVRLDDQVLYFKPGLAHFLEHQLFESEIGNIMGDFTELGANVNAFTSHHETAYYFSTTNDLKQPLNLLLDLVSKATITDDSVEKEKGIIIQELNMYDQMPESVLIKETFKNLYQHHPLIHDIGGSIESVTLTSKDDLMQAYDLFYHPSNMQLVIVTHHPINDVIEWIDEHEFSQRISSKPNTHHDFLLDGVDHLPRRHIINMDVSQNKLTIGIRVTPCSINKKDLLKQQWALKVLLETHFSEVNSEYQTWMDQGVINELFDYDVDVKQDYGHVLFLLEDIHVDDASKFIHHQITKITPSEQILTQLKRRYFFSNLRIFNRPTSLMTQLLHYQLDGINYFDLLDVIQSLTMDDLNLAKQQIIDSPFSVIEMKKEA